MFVWCLDFTIVEIMQMYVLHIVVMFVKAMIFTSNCVSPLFTVHESVERLWRNSRVASYVYPRHHQHHHQQSTDEYKKCRI